MVSQTPSMVPSAETVGQAFANQYYGLLQQSPELVNRFYSDISLLGRPHGELMGCCTTMKAIGEKILSYGNLMTDIKYVDAQDSHDGGVIVLVVGAVVNEDESRRNFTQTFFLAPQEKGYYVLNDIFRFVKDGYSEIDVEHVDGMVPSELSEEVPPMPENHISELSNGEVCNSNEEVHYSSEEVHIPLEDKHILSEEEHIPSEEVHPPSEEMHPPSEEMHNLNGQPPVEEVKEEVQVGEEGPITKVVDEVKQESSVTVESSAGVDDQKKSHAVVESSTKVDTPKKSHVVVESSAKADTPKKSYASIVMKDSPTPMSPPVPPKSVPKMQDRQVAKAPVVVPPPSNETVVEDRVGSNNYVSEGKGLSIYCRNLPHNVTVSRLQEELQEFGPIKSGGIQIRHTPGFSYGFVEFETAAAAQSAIEASPIHIDNHAVGVEEKRSTAGRGGSFGGDNRGRYPPGRGHGSFRGDGVRGHGGYGSGRGYGRGESNRGEFGGRGGGRGYQNRNEGYQKSEHTGNRNEGYQKSDHTGNRGEGYQKSDHTGNVSGHINRGGGSGQVPTRTQGVVSQA